jgi:2-phosphosulfolactate phosphatase
MATSLEVLFTSADSAALARRDLSETVCVVFDVLRATSTIVTALANGAAGIIPVAEISDAIALRRIRPEVLLAGERDGLRIRANLTGGVDFDLGNSPREFTADRVRGKTIALSTTNGSRAIAACAAAKEVLVGSFLNLPATAQYLGARSPGPILLVCSGTGMEASYEDVLGAGALANLMWGRYSEEEISDSAHIARQIYQQNRQDLLGAARHCRNALRLLAIPDLRDDVAWCFERDRFQLVAGLRDGAVVTVGKAKG